MRKIEIAVIGILFGAVPVIACFLAGWWISIPLVPESQIFQWALAGIVVGLIVDLIFLKGSVRRAYSMNPLNWMVVYLFYSIGMFGFFMGVPVFNVLLALPAGFFFGGRLVQIGADSIRMKKAARYCALFTTAVLALICVASALFALASPSTASDLRGTLGLPFPVTHAMIIAIILGGGVFILAFQWWLTLWSVKRAYGYFVERTNLAI